MIGGNKKYTFYRPVESRNVILEETKCYPPANPLFKNVWCRKTRRDASKRVEVKTKQSSRPLIEEFLLTVPIKITVQEDDIAHEVDTGYNYLILGAEDVSRMGQTYQCPIVRVKGIMKAAE